MGKRLLRILPGLIVLGFGVHAAAADKSLPADASLHVTPNVIVLDNPEADQQILVRSAKDVTRRASYQVLDPKIAAVDAFGLVQPKSEGRTVLVVRHDKEEARVSIEVSGLKAPAPVSFRNQVMPILSKMGCNAGSCHGKAEGKNGFKLSVFGFDPEADYEALVKEARGRRLFPSSPDNSLLLRKAGGKIAHGGGRRLDPDGLAYKRLRRWIVEGACYSVGCVPSPNQIEAQSKTNGGARNAPYEVSAIEVEPSQQILGFGDTQQLRVTAVDGAGKRYCVTLEAQYDSNAGAIAKVDGRGWIQAGNNPGQAAILVRYLGHVTICRVTIPRTGERFSRPPENNFIDRLAWDHLDRLGILPSDLADDATFLRRVFLDTIGTLPTVAEARAFLADKRPNKRALLIDQILQRPEYADYWAMRWSDLLRVDRDAVTPAGAVATTRWLRQQLADNRPYDEFVRAILTARGGIADDGPAAIYKVLATPEEISRSFSQLFLGVRIQCAQCHHHPSDRWGQEDYYALAGFFTGIGRKVLPSKTEAIFSQKGTDLNHPRTKKPVPARALGAAAVDFTNIPDRRTVLARWMTTPDNPFFAMPLTESCYWKA